MDYRLHYCGRRRSAMGMLAELQQLHGDRLHAHVGEEGGRAEVAALIGPPDPDARIYACGPVRMLDAVRASSAVSTRGMSAPGAARSSMPAKR